MSPTLIARLVGQPSTPVTATGGLTVIVQYPFLFGKLFSVKPNSSIYVSGFSATIYNSPLLL